MPTVFALSRALPAPAFGYAVLDRHERMVNIVDVLPTVDGSLQPDAAGGDGYSVRGPLDGQTIRA